MIKSIICALVLALASCTFSNQYGDCIGYLDHENIQLNYKTSVRNVIWTVIGSETIVVPVVWALTCAKCPTGYKVVNSQSSEYRVSLDPNFSAQLAAAPQN